MLAQVPKWSLLPDVEGREARRTLRRHFATPSSFSHHWRLLLRMELYFRSVRANSREVWRANYYDTVADRERDATTRVSSGTSHVNFQIGSVASLLRTLHRSKLVF